MRMKFVARDRWGIVSLSGAFLACLLVHAPSARVEAGQAGEPAAIESRGITYTEDQAHRGQMLFRRHCMFCHSTNQGNRKSDQEPLRGFMLGPQLRSVMNLGGREIFRTYPSVYHLFARIREGMPAWDIEAVSPAQKVDIVAFLLKESGVPPSDRELPFDAAVMKTMRLAEAKPLPDEPGFDQIFNGKDFTSLKFLFRVNCTPPPGCGKTDPTVFTVKDQVIVAHGREHGYMYTERRYLDFELRLDYRVVPPPDHDLDDEAFINGGGIFLFVTEHRMFPMGLEIEGDSARMLTPYGLSVPITSTYDEEAAALANKGPGPWNSVRVVSKSGQVDLFLNGAHVGHVSEHPFEEPGHIGIQYQGGTWMYRRLRIKANRSAC